MPFMTQGNAINCILSFLWKKKLKLFGAQNWRFVFNLMMRMRMVFATNLFLQPHVRVDIVGETPGARLSCLLSKIDLEAALINA